MKKLNLLFTVLLFYAVNIVCADINEDLLGVVKGGSVESVQSILKKGADVNAKDKDGTTALMWASSGGHTDIVKLLIEKGVDVNAKDDRESTVLDIASRHGHKAMVKLLKQAGAKE